MLRYSIITTVVLKLIGGLQLFDLVVALTGGGPGFSTHTISTMINYLYFDAQNAGYSAALGVFLFIVIMALTLFVNKVLKREE
jgi:raffinose/stachyose/melibiose transport system permease protein